MTDPKKGQKIASFNIDVTLYDPNPGDVSRGGQPLVPDDTTVKAVTDAVDEALTAMGYDASVRGTRTDR